MSNDLETSECFHCGNAGNSLFYPHIESILGADASIFLSYIMGWFAMPCPYCRYDAYWGRE